MITLFSMNINAQHHKAIFLVLTGVLIFWIGRLTVQYEIHKELPPVQEIPEMNEKIPMVDITDIRGAQIFGTVNKTEIRLKSGESVAVPDENNEFVLDIQHLGYLGEKKPVILHQMPEWAQFVASKSGKYFYELDEPTAKNLSVENRLYFANEEEAMKEGFQKRSR
jgi:hypothetical protein